jgi:hypothetical protein
MISARIEPDFEALARMLEAKAKVLAEAAGETTAMKRASDPRRWRNPRLLWPLFTKG